MTRERLSPSFRKTPVEHSLLNRLYRRCALLVLLYTLATQASPASANPETNVPDSNLNATSITSDHLSSQPEVPTPPENILVIHRASESFSELPKRVNYYIKIESLPGKKITVENIELKTYSRPNRETPSIKLKLELDEERRNLSKPIIYTYHTAFDTSFNNTAVTQIILVQYKVEGSDRIITTSARAEVIFGRPPVTSGCWPTDGYVNTITKYPDGTFHSVTNGPSWGVIGTAVDIKAPEGTPVVSPFYGTACTNCVYANSEYGNLVTVTNTEGVDLIFAHLLYYWDKTTVSGMTKDVKPGDIIGYVGSTGESAGGYSHLHYEVPAQTRNHYLFIAQMLPQKPYISQVVSSESCKPEPKAENEPSNG